MTTVIPMLIILFKNEILVTIIFILLLVEDEVLTIYNYIIFLLFDVAFTHVCCFEYLLQKISKFYICEGEKIRKYVMNSIDDKYYTPEFLIFYPKIRMKEN